MACHGSHAGISPRPLSSKFPEVSRKVELSLEVPPNLQKPLWNIWNPLSKAAALATDRGKVSWLRRRPLMLALSLLSLLSLSLSLSCTLCSSFKSGALMSVVQNGTSLVQETCDALLSCRRCMADLALGCAGEASRGGLCFQARQLCPRGSDFLVTYGMLVFSKLSEAL